MRNVKILAALGLMTMAGIAQADVTGTATIASDYDFRGVTQTDGNPALQLSIDFATESGWYVGGWGSNIDWLSTASQELDLYTGFKGATDGGLGWDVGVVYYSYPGESDFNTAEIYGKLSYSVLTGAVYYTDNYFNADESAFYVSADAAIPVGPLSLGLHAGLSQGDGIAASFGGSTNAEDSYTDYGIGISYSASNLTLGVKWVTTTYDDSSDDRILFTVGTALPWK